MSSPTRVPFRSAVLGGLLVAAAAGCDDAGPERASGIDAATGAVLADAADRLAVALDGDDPCLVLAEADALLARVRDADAEAPPQVLAETTRVARAVTSEVVCDPDEVPTDVEAGAGEGEALEAPDATDGPATGGPVEPAEAPAGDAGRTDDDVDADRGQNGNGNGDGNGDARGNGNANANGATSGGGPPPGRGGRG